MELFKCKNNRKLHKLNLNKSAINIKTQKIN